VSLGGLKPLSLTEWAVMGLAVAKYLLAIALAVLFWEAIYD